MEVGGGFMYRDFFIEELQIPGFAFLFWGGRAYRGHKISCRPAPWQAPPLWSGIPFRMRESIPWNRHLRALIKTEDKTVPRKHYRI